LSFKKTFQQYNWDTIKAKIYSYSNDDVMRVLAGGCQSLEDFAALLSPAAENHLDQMSFIAHAKTRKRFGKSIQLYAPLYLSNECTNICTYCGFSMENKIPRRTLSSPEILKEIKAIKRLGFDHVLLVTGEAPKEVNSEYIQKAIELCRNYFSQISIEVQPLKQNEYESMISAGLNAVYVYQETYHKDEYKKHHPKGKKSNFNYRIDTPDRLGQANIHKIGLGVLLGLEDWRVDSFFCALHLDYLEKKYWQTKFSLSFPRLRPHAGIIQPKVEITDKQLVQLILAYRLFNEDVEISLSTRESPFFRDGILPLGITSMSAGSKTDPGGYAHQEEENLEQFEISDERSPAEVAARIKELGFQPVWKDWDESYNQQSMLN
jgi:2-iminoacetate synthase